MEILIKDKLWEFSINDSHVKYYLKNDKAHNAIIARSWEFYESFRGIAIIPEIMIALKNHAEKIK